MRFRRLLVPFAAGLALVPAGPGLAAHGPDRPERPDRRGCVDGQAAEASAERPHLVDPAGDLHPLGGTVAGEDRDLLLAWVHADDDGVLTTNMRMAAAPGRDEVEYVFAYGDRSYVSARGSSHGFRYTWGTVEQGPGAKGQHTTSYRERGETTGSLDDATITVVLPAESLSSLRAHGSRLPIRGLHTRTLHSADPEIGVSLAADDASNARVCAVLLEGEPRERPTRPQDG